MRCAVMRCGGLYCCCVSLDVEGGPRHGLRGFLGWWVVDAAWALSGYLGVDSALMYWQYPCCGAEAGRGCEPEVGECEATEY